MKTVQIATPMFGGLAYGHYVLSILALEAQLVQKGIGVSFSFLMNESLITRARNTLAMMFINSPEKPTHLLFIDSDIRFDARHVPAMVEADVPILCGIYPKKEINWHQVEAAVKKGAPVDMLRRMAGTYPLNPLEGRVEAGVLEPLEIKSGPTGFMLIKREVFEAIEPSVPTYIGDGPFGKVRTSEFFTTKVEDDALLSEDYYFCGLAKAHGFKVYAWPWIDLFHIGMFEYAGQMHMPQVGENSPVGFVKQVEEGK
jgi:hypothetical protein